MGRVDLIYSLKSGQKSKSRRLTYVNPAVDDSVLAEVAAALAGLSDNDLEEAYRIEREDLDMAKTAYDPEVELETTIHAPDTLGVIWQGGGDMTVSLQNDIADYTIQGNQVIFDLKENHDSGTYATDALIIIGENGDYQSDSAQFTLTADYPEVSIKPSPQLRCRRYIYNNNTQDTIYWLGGDLSVDVAQSANCSVSLSPVSLTGTGRRQVVYYKYKTTPSKPDSNTSGATVDEVTIRVAESEHFAAQSFINTVAAVNWASRVTLQNENSDSFKNITTCDTTRANQDDNFTNYGACCSIHTSIGNDSITNYGPGCTICSSAGLDTIVNYGASCTVSLYGSIKSVHNEGEACSISADTLNAYNSGYNCSIYASGSNSTIDNSGDNCTISVGSNATIDNSGDNCTIYASGSNATIDNSGDNCSISVGSNATIDNSGDNCTIAGRGRINANGKDFVYNWRSSANGVSIYGAGAHSTIYMPNQIGSNYYYYYESVAGDNLILTQLYSSTKNYITIYGGAVNDFVYEVI